MTRQGAARVLFTLLVYLLEQYREVSVYTNDQVGSCVLVNGHNVRDAVDSELPRVMSIAMVAQVQAMQDLDRRQ